MGFLVWSEQVIQLECIISDGEMAAVQEALMVWFLPMVLWLFSKQLVAHSTYIVNIVNSSCNVPLN
jgi:hypothetical protein